MILALDTSTPACTAALFAADGSLFARADQVIGRGHAEYLAPMIADMLGGHVPASIIVGIGPGSFTGLRIGLACAHGMAVGWDIPILGMDSLALIAASEVEDGPVAIAVTGGHGELFVAEYDRPGLIPMRAVANLTPAAAAQLIVAPIVIGSGAESLVAARGSGEAIDRLPSAADALAVPLALRSLPPSPLYARAPDARPIAA
ncbi:MAG: tRNA (adenosine(37)-N6)-threonylcarbamoyltransferase complex dimerization subunit type 1 TsaB [Sphingomonas bacterium]|nr:tRNA (adenosine(37)-N6)-threonylcarbamoyltransferase complex dimerization subunit type 1 TsaB [Sphingomonas bacterium]